MRAGIRLAAGLSLVALVAACGGRPAPTPEAAPMVSSSLRFELDRFAGRWLLREATAGVGPLRAITVTPEGGDRFTWRAETMAGVTERAGRVIGPGRLRLSGSGARDLWVLWVDEGFRTAALGAPDGTVALIIDRAPSGGADRIEAAREMIDFNGFDRARLAGVTDG